MALKDLTLSNARPFYLSMGNPLGVKGLKILRMDTGLTNITWISLRYWRSQKYWTSHGLHLAVNCGPTLLTLHLKFSVAQLDGYLWSQSPMKGILNFQPLKRYLGLFPPFSFLFPFCCNFAFTAVCVLFARNIWQLRKLCRIKQRRHHNQVFFLELKRK